MSVSPITAAEMGNIVIDVLAGGLRGLREWVRKIVYRRASTRVLVLGDSHVRVFEHWRFLWGFPHTRFDVVYVPGGTASGIRNRASKTGAYRIFSEALASREHDLVMVNLGEVDTAYTLWWRAEHSGKDVEDLMATAVQHYCAFLTEVSQEHALVVISACLPTVADYGDVDDAAVTMRRTVKASQVMRTALALRFNALIAGFCAQHGIPYLNCAAAALGPQGIVRSEWVNQSWPDHHYARSAYAGWMVAAMQQMPQATRVDLR